MLVQQSNYEGEKDKHVCEPCSHLVIVSGLGTHWVVRERVILDEGLKQVHQNQRDNHCLLSNYHANTTQKVYICYNVAELLLIWLHFLRAGEFQKGAAAQGLSLGTV